MILDGFFKSLSGVAKPDDWLTDWAGGSKVSSGVRVNEKTALNLSSAWCATRIIAESMACLPAIVYRRMEGTGRERDKSNTLWKVLHDRPNREMNAFTYHEMQTAFLVNWGNSYALKERRIDGQVIGLWPIHPAQVRPYRDEQGELWYFVTDNKGNQEPYSRDEILHITGPLSEDGITGKGVIRQARETLGIGMAMELFEGHFFGNGAFPGGVIEHPGNPSKEAADRIREGWQKRHGGISNAGSVAFLREGAVYKSIGWPLEDLQFLGLRQFNVTEISRWYRVPPHMLAELSKATFSNIEEQGMEFLTYTVTPWAKRTEEAYNEQLLPDDSENYVEFLIDALNRAKTNDRAESLKTQFMHGAITLDEWRELENRNPVGGEIGSAHFVPVNLMPAERIMQAPTPEKKKPEPKDPEAKPIGDAGLDHKAIADACYLSLLADIDRMQGKESKAMLRAANDPNTFLDTMESFYEKHRQLMIDAVSHSLDAYLLASGETELTAEGLVNSHIARAKDTLLKATECKADELNASITKTIERWSPDQYTKEATPCQS